MHIRMSGLSVIGLSFGLTAGLASAAHAGSFMTPSIARSGALMQRLHCNVLNAKPKAIGPLTVRILDETGAVVVFQDYATLDPKAIGWVIAGHANLGATLYGSCEIEGTGVSKKKTPATLCVTAETSTNCEAAVTTP